MNQFNYFISYSKINFARLLSDNTEIIKEVYQKIIESSDSDANEENETFESISPTMAISSLDIRKFLVSQNAYTNKTEKK